MQRHAESKILLPFALSCFVLAGLDATPHTAREFVTFRHFLFRSGKYEPHQNANSYTLAKLSSAARLGIIIDDP